MQLSIRINEVLDAAADAASDVVNADVLATAFAQFVGNHMV